MREERVQILLDKLDCRTNSQKFSSNSDFSELISNIFLL